MSDTDKTDLTNNGPAETEPHDHGRDLQILVRHQGQTPRERSTCGWRDRLISREDSRVAAWAHAVDIPPC